jgi:urease accessory protein
VQRARDVKPAGQWDAGAAVDRVVLDADERRRRRVTLIGECGTRFLLDLPRATMLRDGDGLVLDTGAIVRVAGQAEPLMEIAGRDPHHLARLAWHLGNRHTDVQVVGERLRLRRDHVLREMLLGLGATAVEIEAPFDPEHGAYGRHGHDHHDGHDHGA